MSYRSKYTGAEIEDALSKAKNAVTKSDLAAKQDYLRSGENIKTINGQSILGSGNIEIQGGGGIVIEYTAFINLITPNFNAVLKDTTGHYIEFTFDTKNQSGNSLGESVTCTYTIVRGSSKKTVTERYRYGTQVKFNIDKYLQEGANDITINIVGNISNASTAVGLTYQVVNLQLTTDYDISQIYNLQTIPQSIVEIPFTLSGYGTKIVEWYLDGNKIATEPAIDEVTGTSATRTKRISVANLSQGKHSVQLRAYTVIDGETFYTDTLYRDIIVYTGVNTNPIIALSATLPSGIVMKGDLELSGAVQYIPYVIDFSVHNPLGSAINVIIKVDGIQQASITATSGVVNTFAYTPMTSGNKTITFMAGTSVYIVPITVIENDNALEEITDQLELDLQAIGKTNMSSDKDVWVYGDYFTTFNGFEWTSLSGWNDGTLVIGNGDSININIQPLKKDATTTGKTMEFEFSTSGVMNDDAVVCDLRDSSGTGILITASKVSLISAGGKTLSTPFKSEENIRVSFVINKDSGVTNKGLAFVYVNGIISGSVNFSETDNFMSSATLSFAGSESASVILRSLRFYNAALTHDQILNNYILYRRNVSEMMDVYNRNDVYEEGTENLSAEDLANQLPVMIITGDIPALEATTDKNKSIVVDVEYINYQNPRLSFTLKNGHMQPQGTSSMGYPKKNFRLYTQKRDDTVLYDYEGAPVADRLYAFKEGSAPVNCWCMKADYAESSGTHNTGIAKLWNDALKNMKVDDVFVGRTNAQQAAIDNEYPYDVRTTIDGFPILMFYRLNDTSDTVFIGKYNFNNDKETERVFGFVDIPGFDNSRMQCWEVLNNGNHLALFQDTINFDSEWTDAFESRYPDTKTPNVTDLKNFATWITTTNDFATEKWQHLDVYKMAAYYVYVMRFGAVDQMVKNAMFTSEDGQKFYYINYDNDTINGLRNDGYLIYSPTITRQSLDETYDIEVYAYAGHDSTLWNYLESDKEFMTIVQNVDAALYNAGLTYTNVIKMFDEEQSNKWCERIYNLDAQYKYVSPYVEQGINNLFMLQGSRESHRRWWLSKRFSFVDSLFVSGEYKSNVIEAKLANAPIGIKFNVTAGVEGNYGYGVNNVPISYGISLAQNEKHTFTTEQVLNIGDPLRIYAAPNVSEVDLSNFIQYMSTLNVDGIYTSTLGTKLKSLILGVDSSNDTRRNTSLNLISGLNNASKLELLNIEGYKAITSLNLSGLVNLRSIKAYESGLTSISLPDGSPIEHVELPNILQGIVLSGVTNLTAEEFKIQGGWTNVSTINIKKCPNMTNDWGIIKNWYKSKVTEDSKCALTMEGIEWSDVEVADLIALSNIKTSGGVLNLKGIIRLVSVDSEQMAILRTLYGEYVFVKGGELFITAPDGVFIKGENSVIEGDGLQFTADVVSEYLGNVEWSVNGDGASIDQHGYLTTTETGVTRNIVITVKHTSTQNSVISATKTISVMKAVRPTSGTIAGPNSIVDDATYTLTVSPNGINREYSVNWQLSGTAYTNGYVTIKSYDNTKCIIDVLSDTAFGDLKITATITTDKNTVITASKNVIVGTTLTLNILSNQGTDQVISNVEAIVTYGSTTNKIKNGGQIYLPINQLIKITYPNVTGYATPSMAEYTSTIEQKSISATYNTTIVTVTMNDNQPSLNDIANAKATVKYDSISTQLASGDSVKVPTGKSITVTWDAVNGYSTPTVQTFTVSGTSVQCEGVYCTTIVTVKMTDNQSAYNDIADATAYVFVNGIITVTVSDGETVKIPTGASCTITWSNVPDYKTPDEHTFTASGASVTKTGLYQTEILTINVISDIALPANYTITVSGIGSQTNSSKIYKIPFGTNYTISATTVNGYKTPEDKNFTANIENRIVTMEYLESFEPIDLSRVDIYENTIEQTTANCYIIKRRGTYKFPLVFGNAIVNGIKNSSAYTKKSGEYNTNFVDSFGNVISSPYIEDVSGDVVSAQLSITDTKDMVSNINIVDGDGSCRYVQFDVTTIPNTGANGIISIINQSSSILWNWHIWIWPYDLTPVEITNATGIKYNILPVNLATKLDSADSINKTTGWKNWHYQWGRPTPFICGAYYNSTSNHSTYGNLQTWSTSTTTYFYDCIKKPTTFFYQNTKYGDNWFNANYNCSMNLWDANFKSFGASDNNVIKTIYDPCPIGFKIPNANVFNSFTKDNVLGQFSNGFVIKRYENDTIGVFFPTTGVRNSSNFNIFNPSGSGQYSTASFYSDTNLFTLYFTSSYMNISYTSNRSTGYAVRPVQE